MAHWKVINEEDALLILKIEARTFPADFYTQNFLGGVSRYAATPLIVALSTGHCDITRFRPWSALLSFSGINKTGCSVQKQYIYILIY